MFIGSIPDTTEQDLFYYHTYNTFFHCLSATLATENHYYRPSLIFFSPIFKNVIESKNVYL